MQYQAIGRFLFVKRLEYKNKSKFAVEKSEDDLTYFEVQSIGDQITNCKPGDQVVLRAGNYEPVPLLGNDQADQLFIAQDDDVAGVVTNV